MLFVVVPVVVVGVEVGFEVLVDSGLGGFEYFVPVLGCGLEVADWVFVGVVVVCVVAVDG